MAGTTTLPPLESFQAMLIERSEAISQGEPRLNPDITSVEDAIPELKTFRNLPSFFQPFYYAFHQETIEAALEYEALSTLHTRAHLLNLPLISQLMPLEKATWEIFAPKPPHDTEAILNTITGGSYSQRHAALKKQLNNDPQQRNKSELIKAFVTQLKDEAIAYHQNNPHKREGQFALIFADHIEKTYNKSRVQGPGIMLKDLSPDAATPAHLLTLPAQGNREDFENLPDMDETTNGASDRNVMTASRRSPSFRLPPLKQEDIEVKKVYGFWLFRFSILSELNTRISSYYAMFTQANMDHQRIQSDDKAKLIAVKRSANHFFQHWLLSLINDLQGLVSKTPAPAPVTEAPSTGNSSSATLASVTTAFSDFIGAIPMPTPAVSIPTLPGFLGGGSIFGTVTAAPQLDESLFKLPDPDAKPPEAPTKSGWFW